MKPLYSQKDFNNAKSRDKLPCECYICHEPFYKVKYDIMKFIKTNKSHKIKYCSSKCWKTKQKINCVNCKIEFEKFPSQIKRTSNHFCSNSCAASYNNTHKTTGTRRSKLEMWLEEQLTKLYPKLEIHFNKKNTIGSELDIYIPKLNLAFELNGIFHYEPIYGLKKLDQIKTNDICKTKACHNAKIDLCIINVTGLKYFKPNNAQQYLDIIVNIISKN